MKTFILPQGQTLVLQNIAYVGKIVDARKSVIPMRYAFFHINLVGGERMTITAGASPVSVDLPLIENIFALHDELMKAINNPS